jgi:hypothetical protein
MPIIDVPAPTNADGRYYWFGSASGVTGGQINFVGDLTLLTGNAALTWTVLQRSGDGSYPVVTYSTDGGTTLHSAQVGSEGTPQEVINESGDIVVSLTAATGFIVNVTTAGGAPITGAKQWILAIAITRNTNETLAWDTPNPFDPVNYNAQRLDFSGYPSATLLALRTRMINRLGFKTLLNEVPGLTLLQMQTYLMQRLGFSNQAANPPPGMAALLTSIINEAQQGLYRRYAQDTYIDAAPPLLVNPTDTLTLDNLAVQLLATATGKAHYGQKDASIIGNQFENYLAELKVRFPPNLVNILNDFLTSAQTYLYRRYTALHTRRFFRWKVIPGQRFYSLKDNDEDILGAFHLDPAKKIEWVGIQDTRNVWYPLIQGIPPQLYTMITKPWRPARYDIRQAIELYPAPDQTYWLWMRAHFGLLAFSADTDTTTIDSELVFLHALANAKSHFKQPDANNIEAQANAYRAELIAGTHQTAHYIPGTIAVPPAVRPTLIQFDANQGA